MPEPESPVTTVSESRGMTTSTPLRLWTFAFLMVMSMAPRPSRAYCRFFKSSASRNCGFDWVFLSEFSTERMALSVPAAAR